MSKLVQRIVALVVMLAVVMSATAYGASTFVVDYQELKSDAPVVMTVNGEEIHADEYASYMMSQIINYQQMYAMYGLSEKNMASTFGDAAKESAKQQVALIHIVKQKMDELGLSLSYSQKKNIVTANKQNAEQLGGEDAYLQRLASIGFDMDNYNNYQYVSACAQVLKDYYFGENGVSVPSDDELQKYFDDNYITAKHILILTTNPSTGETTRTDEEAKKEDAWTTDSSDGSMYFFLDENQGWRLAVVDAAAGSRFYQLEHTTDGGTNWETASTDPFLPLIHI